MVRLAALALIILAFARPLLDGQRRADGVGAGAREVVVLLDTSYSMGYGDRWERARAAARDAIDGLGAVGSRLGRAVLRRAPTSRCARPPETSALHGGGRRGEARRRPRRATRRRSRWPAASWPNRRCRGARSVLISDFQRGGWRGEEGARLPAGATLTPVPIQGAADEPNVSVTGVSLARSTFSDQERVAVTAGVTNRTERPVDRRHADARSRRPARSARSRCSVEAWQQPRR